MSFYSSRSDLLGGDERSAIGDSGGFSLNEEPDIQLGEIPGRCLVNEERLETPRERR